MSEKQLIRYMALADDYGEIARIFFVIDETGEEIEGYPQIQNWVNNLYKENKELKEENEQLKEYQRTLESKIVRLKDRVKTFEKHYSRKDIERYKKMEKCNCITSDRLRRYS